MKAESATASRPTFSPASMAATALLAPLLLAAALATSACADPRHVVSGAEPRDGLQTLQLEKLWSAGGPDDDIFFGLVTIVRSDDRGNVYILDSQLSEAHVYGPDGEYLGTRFGEGEGPGELRRGRDLAVLPGGGLAALQETPARMMLLDQAGDPLKSFKLAGDSDVQIGFWEGYAVEPAGDDFLVAGVNSMVTDDHTGRVRISFLSTFDRTGRELVRFVESRGTFDFTNFVFSELEHMPGFWWNLAVGPDGRVYTVPDRNSYRIEVFRPDGQKDLVVEREYEHLARTGAEKKLMHDMVADIFKNAPMQVNIEVEGDHPDILTFQRGLRVRDDGSIWVLSSRGGRENPEGVMATFDVFDPDGTFARQVAFACDGDGMRDGIFFLGDDRVVVVKGYLDAVAAQYGDGARLSGDDQEALMEVVCYRVANPRKLNR